MDFYIKKGATLPLLKMQVVQDGRVGYQNFMSFIETSSIFFSMVDIDSGTPKIISKPAYFVEKTKIHPDSPTEYYVVYQFSSKDTNRVGRYKGQFLLKNDEGDLIVPIREDLFINVQESIITPNNCC